MKSASHVYEFVFRGHLASQALSSTGLLRAPALEATTAALGSALNYELLDAELLESAQQMAAVYAAITAFENSARRFITKVLMDAVGADWWSVRVSEKIRRFAEARRDEELKVRWHGQRGQDLIFYTEMGHLVDIMQQNWSDFEPHVRRADWATAIFGVVERSRNVIMHSGTLEIDDIERLGMNIRDWIRQVGA